jgi:hypothetical protein
MVQRGQHGEVMKEQLRNKKRLFENLKDSGGEKMQDNTIMLIMGFITTMIPIFTVIVKLNNTITKLNVTIQVLSDQMHKGQEDRTKIHNQLNNHETRISILENERRER